MAEMTTPICDFGWKAVDFDLPGVDGRNYRLADVAGAGGALVMFLCNHCPFVKAVIGRIVRDVSELAEHGIGAIAIMPNDTASHPADSFDNMKLFAAEQGGPGVFGVMVSSLNIIQDRLSRSRLAGDPPDVLLAPRLGHVVVCSHRRGCSRLIGVAHSARTPLIVESVRLVICLACGGKCRRPGSVGIDAGVVPDALWVRRTRGRVCPR